MEKVNVIDVKRSFILTHAMKSPFESGEGIIKSYYEEKEKYIEYDEEKLDRLMNGLELGKSLEEINTSKEIFKDQDRITRYRKLSWSQGLVSLRDMGAWPEMRGIDPRLTTENIINTAQEMYKHTQEITKYNFSDKRKVNIESLENLIESMKSNPVIFTLPIILVPGDSIRGEAYKKWVMENHKDYHKHNTKLLGIDEGNVRALTFTFLGKDKVPSYIGTYKN